MTAPTFSPEVTAELEMLRAGMADAGPAEAADAVMASMDCRVPWDDIKRHIDLAIDKTVDAMSIQDRPARRRRTGKAWRRSELFEAACTAAGDALLLAVTELADMSEVQRETLAELARARQAANYYAARCNALEVVLQEQTGIDIRDYMGRA